MMTRRCHGCNRDDDGRKDGDGADDGEIGDDEDGVVVAEGV